MTPAGLVLALAAIWASAADAAPAPSAAARAWGFHRGDLVPHPGVRFGVLANGMRYALMRGAGGLSARLHVDAGSAVEGRREAGWMHLLEHLIFEESANLPRMALPLMLDHQGIASPSDFNAFTDPDQTVYRLDLPRADAGARATALTVMREVAGNLVFDRRVVDRARDAVRREIRARDAAADRLLAAQNAFFFPGSLRARGSTAGTIAGIGRADGKALRRLYARHYTPGRTTLVLVGDFDPTTLEAEVAARFSDWRAQAVADTSSALPAPSPSTGRRGVEACLHVDAAAPTRVTMAAVEPLGGADARGRRDALFLEHLGFGMLNRRLARIGATAAVYDHPSAARIARIDVPARAGDWRAALDAGAAELRRATAGGFSQAELDEQLAVSRRALDRSAAPATGPALADALVDAVGRGIVFTAPADGSANADYLARIRLADIDAAFRAAWASPSRLIFVSHDRRVPGGEAAVAAAWTRAARAPIPDADRRVPAS